MALQQISETQKSVEETLTMIWQRESDYEEACNEQAEAEHNYKLNDAKSFLAADGNIKEREATALIANQKLHLDYLQKKARKEFTKEKLRDAQDALSARQSLLSYEAKTNFGYTQQT